LGFTSVLALLCVPALFQGDDVRGAVATSSTPATEAAAEILAAGGNSVDAAVAAGFALAVSWPQAGNLGGGGFLLYRSPDGEARFLDFREVAPAEARPDFYRNKNGRADQKASLIGWRAVAVPGSVPGMAEAHRRWGRLSWTQVLEPAIRLAREGFPVTPELQRLFQNLRPSLTRDPIVRETFYTKSGEALSAGTILKQPRLAETLSAISEKGAEVFRQGAIVDGIVEASRKGGGILTAGDFLSYEPKLRPVHRFTWQDLEILSPSPPSSGGVFLEQTLKSLSPTRLRLWGFRDARSIQVIGEASARAFADRNLWLGDPDGLDFNPDALVDNRFLEFRRAALIPFRATPSMWLKATAWEEGDNTTHYSIMDADGGACSVTTTLNSAFGARVMAPGGFFLNNEMNDFSTAPKTPNQYGLIQGNYNEVVPGHRPLSSMSPVIVVRNGKVDAVLGSPGGPTILTTVMQVLINHYVFRMDGKSSVAAPRFHRQDYPATLRFEPRRLTAPAIIGLRWIGQPMLRSKPIGDVNAIFRDAKGNLVPVTDPRRGSGPGLVARKKAGVTLLGKKPPQSAASRVRLDRLPASGL